MSNKRIIYEIKEVLYWALSFGGLIFRANSVGYMPRWVILFIDLAIITLSGVFTYFLLNGTGLHYIAQDHKLLATAIFFIVNLFFFRAFRVYSGIIRHSSFIDGIKIFFSQFLSFIVFIIINVLFIAFSPSGQ